MCNFLRTCKICLHYYSISVFRYICHCNSQLISHTHAGACQSHWIEEERHCTLYSIIADIVQRCSPSPWRHWQVSTRGGEISWQLQWQVELDEGAHGAAWDQCLGKLPLPSPPATLMLVYEPQWWSTKYFYLQKIVHFYVFQIICICMAGVLLQCY